MNLDALIKRVGDLKYLMEREEFERVRIALEGLEYDLKRVKNGETAGIYIQ